MPRQSQVLAPASGGSGVGLPLTRATSGVASDAEAGLPVNSVGGQQS
jgi:hypothetical protein